MEAYCSFDNYSDPCGAVKWAPQDKTFVPLLSCTVDLSGWLKNKYKGSGASGIRGRPAVVVVVILYLNSVKKSSVITIVF